MNFVSFTNLIGCSLILIETFWFTVLPLDLMKTWYVDVTRQGDIKNVIKRGSTCLFSRHNADKYGY